MSRKQCKESLELYKKFVVRMELVAKFLAVAEVSQFQWLSHRINCPQSLSPTSVRLLLE